MTAVTANNCIMHDETSILRRAYEINFTAAAKSDTCTVVLPDGYTPISYLPSIYGSTVAFTQNATTGIWTVVVTAGAKATETFTVFIN